MTAKLNQILAIEKGVKARTLSALTALYKSAQKPDPFNGFNNVYEKKDEADADDLPPENKRVQLRVTDMLRLLENDSAELFETTARKDWTNCTAKADVVVDGATLIPGAPVTYLLFLEKQFTDIRTFLGSLPTLDESEEWNRDDKAQIYRTVPVRTHRTKKVSKPIVLYPATPEHPAQTQLITEDIIAGYWVKSKTSGAIAPEDKRKLLVRVEKLLNAIKEAREKANMVDEVMVPDVGAPLFSYLFEGSE